MSRGGAETDNISCITDAMIHQPLQNEFTIYKKISWLQINFSKLSLKE